MKVLDLFCGVGGLSWGFERVGFKIIGGIDVWEKALKVFKNVHTNARVLLADLSKLSDKEILREFKEVDVVVGGPPCQAFSTVGKRALEDSRAWLVKEFVRVVKVLRPEVFVFENVKGFTSFAKGFLVREVLEELDKLGYNLDFEILNAVNFSVPQVRERFIIVGGLVKMFYCLEEIILRERRFGLLEKRLRICHPLKLVKKRINILLFLRTIYKSFTEKIVKMS